MAILHRLDDVLVVVERSAVVLLLTGLVGLGLLQIVLRNLLASGLFWADGLLRHMVLWLGFLGASLATRERRHLSIDVLMRVLPVRGQPWFTLLTELVAALICALLTRDALTLVQYEYTAGTVLAFGVATWLAQSIIPLGFLTMTLRFALRALATLLQIVRGQPSS
jgi:C4-dicarboxylate transporter DctQ subunit